MTRLCILPLILLLLPSPGLAGPSGEPDLLTWRPQPMPRRDAPPQQDTLPGPEHVVTRDLATGATTVRLADELPRFASAGSMPGSPGLLGNDDGRGGPETNFGPHTAVPDPSAYPYRTHVRLRMMWVAGSDTSFAMCSGTLIGPRHVLTAGHCAYSHDDGGWAASIEVVPAYDRGDKPFGNAFVTQIHSWEGWTDDEDPDHDVALLDLDRPVGGITGWRGYGYDTDCGFFTGGSWQRPGYPAEEGFDSQVMYVDSGDYDGCDEIGGSWYGYEVWADRPGIGGTSGSGAVRNGSVWAVRSNTSFDLLNGYDAYDTRLTGGKFGDIVDWIAEDTPAVPDLSPLTLDLSHASRAAGEYLSTSWLVVYNHGTAGFSGAVTGTAYLSTDTDITPGDVPLGTFSSNHTLGAPGGDWVGLPGWRIPPGTPPGQYFVGVILSTPDANAGNNRTYPVDAASLTVGCAAQQAPLLLSPDDDEECEPRPVTLRWSAVPGATGYRLTLYRGFTTSVIPLLGTEFQATLGDGERVRWTVEARFDCGGTTVYGPGAPSRFFTVEAETPLAPELTFPPDGAACLDNDVELDWVGTRSSSTWDDYQIWLGSDCATIITIAAAEYSHHEFLGLLPGTEYAWKVRGRNRCGEVGPWSECRTFRTAPGALAAPAPDWPADGATCVDTLGPTVGWNPVSGVDTYRVSFGPSGCFDDADTSWTVDATATLSTLPPVAGGVTYHWSVVAVDSCGADGISSPCREFTTRPPKASPPAVLGPEPGACSPPDVSLSWEPVPGADQYQVQMVTGFCSFPMFTISYSTGGTSLVIPSRPEGQNVWRIRSRGPCGVWGPWSGCRAVQVDATAPGALQGPASPSHTTGEWSNDPDIALSWLDPAGEPCPVGVSVAVDLIPSTLPDAVVDVPGSPGQPATHTVNIPSSGGGWWVHVRPVDAAGHTGPTSHLGPFDIDTVAPSLSADHPGGFETFAPGEEVDIAWTTSDAHSGVVAMDVSFSADGGETFSPIGLFRPEFSPLSWTVPDTASSDCYIRIVATDDAGNSTEEWTHRPFAIVPQTGVGDDVAGAGAVLSAGRPNPFRSATTVTVTLDEPRDVRLAVYDAAGRRVRDLGGDTWGAGRHDVRWNGADDRGRTVGAGVYFLRLESTGQSEVRRLLRIP